MYDFNEYEDLNPYESGTSEFYTNAEDEYAYATHEYSNGQSDLDQMFEFEDLESESEFEDEVSESSEFSNGGSNGRDSSGKTETRSNKKKNQSKKPQRSQKASTSGSARTMRQQVSQLKQSIQGMTKVVTMTVATTATVATVAVASGGTFLPQVSQYVEQIAEVMNEPLVSPREGLDFDEFVVQLAGLDETGAETVAEVSTEETTPEETTVAAVETTAETSEETLPVATEEESTEESSEESTEETTAPESVEETTAPPETSPEPESSSEETTTAAESTTETTTSGGGGGDDPTTAPETTTAAAQYTITFKNDDGTVLETQQLDAGATPAYSGTTPTKADSSAEFYIFEDWNPQISTVSADAEYTANYHSFVIADKIDKTTYRVKCSEVIDEYKYNDTVDIYKCADCDQYCVSKSGTKTLASAEDILLSFRHFGTITPGEPTGKSFNYTCSECGEHTVSFSMTAFGTNNDAYDFKFTDDSSSSVQYCPTINGDYDKYGAYASYSGGTYSTSACTVDDYYGTYGQMRCYFKEDSGNPGSTYDTLYIPCCLYNMGTFTYIGGFKLDSAAEGIKPYAGHPSGHDVKLLSDVIDPTSADYNATVAKEVGCRMINSSYYYCSTCGDYLNSDGSAMWVVTLPGEGIDAHRGSLTISGNGSSIATPVEAGEAAALTCASCREADRSFTVKVTVTQAASSTATTPVATVEVTNSNRKDFAFNLSNGATVEIVKSDGSASIATDDGSWNFTFNISLSELKQMDCLYVKVTSILSDSSTCTVYFKAANPFYESALGAGLLGSSAPAATPSDATYPDSVDDDADASSGDGTGSLPASSGSDPYLPVSNNSSAGTSGSSDPAGTDDDDSGDS